jgi:hypothetical protein
MPLGPSSVYLEVFEALFPTTKVYGGFDALLSVSVSFSSLCHRLILSHSKF